MYNRWLITGFVLFAFALSAMLLSQQTGAITAIAQAFEGFAADHPRLLPGGGLRGEVLTKDSGTDHDTQWEGVYPAGGAPGQYLTLASSLSASATTTTRFSLEWADLPAPRATATFTGNATSSSYAATGYTFPSGTADDEVVWVFWNSLRPAALIRYGDLPIATTGQTTTQVAPLAIEMDGEVVYLGRTAARELLAAYTTAGGARSLEIYR